MMLIYICATIIPYIVANYATIKLK